MNEKVKKEAAAAESPDKSTKVSWDDSDMQTTYANVANVTSTREEVTLFFGTNQTWNAADGEFTVLLSNRLILSPYAAKRLSILLNGVLKEYESRNGELKLEGTASNS